jgi:hypothetical protein
MAGGLSSQTRTHVVGGAVTDNPQNLPEGHQSSGLSSVAHALNEQPGVREPVELSSATIGARPDNTDMDAEGLFDNKCSKLSGRTGPKSLL